MQLRAKMMLGCWDAGMLGCWDAGMLECLQLGIQCVVLVGFGAVVDDNDFEQSLQGRRVEHFKQCRNAVARDLRRIEMDDDDGQGRRAG